MVCALCCGCGVKRGLREVQSRIEPRLSVCAARNSTSPKVPGNPQTSHAILLMPLCLHVLEVGTQESKKCVPPHWYACALLRGSSHFSCLYPLAFLPAHLALAFI